MSNVCFDLCDVCVYESGTVDVFGDDCAKVRRILSGGLILFIG